MYLTLIFARQQGAADGKTARDLAANRLGLPPTPALAWAKAQLALDAARGDYNDLAWRIVYAVSWLEAAQGLRFAGWAKRINNLEKLEKAYSAAGGWIVELAAPIVGTPTQTMQNALKRYHEAGAKASRARLRLLSAWQRLVQDEHLLLRKASCWDIAV